jgi:hypothetical protein
MASPFNHQHNPSETWNPTLTQRQQAPLPRPKPQIQSGQDSNKDPPANPTIMKNRG